MEKKRILNYMQQNSQQHNSRWSKLVGDATTFKQPGMILAK